MVRIKGMAREDSNRLGGWGLGEVEEFTKDEVQKDGINSNGSGCLPDQQ